MKVCFKRGWWRTYGTLTPGNVYRVIGIGCDSFRVIDDLGEPVLFDPKAFDIVDATEPGDWITTHGDEGERYAYPAEFAEPGFFEDWHDGDRAARSKLTAYMHRICWSEAEALEDSANTYMRVQSRHGQRDMPVTRYSELDDQRWEVRKVDVFLDGHMTYAEGRGTTGDTRLGDVPIPSLEEIAASPEFEPASISRAEFERIWEAVISADLQRHLPP